MSPLASLRIAAVLFSLLVLGAHTRHVDSNFLARAVQEYVEHPEHRAQIGMEEELARLKALPPKDIEEAVTEAWPQWLAGKGEKA